MDIASARSVDRDDEANDERARATKRAIPVLTGTTFIAFFGQSMLLPIIGLYAVELGASIVDVGLIFLANMIFAAVLSIPFGSISDRLGRKNMVLIGLSIAASAAILLSQARSPQAVMVLYSVIGVSMAAYSVPLTASMGDYASKERFASGYGWSQVGRSMGYTVGPATGGASAGFLGFESTFVLAGLVQLTALLLALILLPRAPTMTRAILKAGRQGGVGETLRDRAILITLITVFMLHTAMGSLGSFFPLYLSDIGFSRLMIGALFALQAFTYAMARFLVAGYSDRTGQRALPLSLGLIGVAITLAFVATFQSLFVIAAIVALLGLSFGVANLLQGTIVAERTDHHTRGMAIGLFTSVLTAGIGVGPGALAFLVASQGFEAGFRVNALFIISSAIVFLALKRMTKLR